MATFNDLKTIIANIDEALGEGHIIKYFPERYSSTPTKTFASKDLAKAYGAEMFTKYQNV
jgi:predicted nucleic acid-binding OB-fold protein